VAPFCANPKVTETFTSMDCGECVIEPGGAAPHQLAAAVLEAQALPATWEVEEASRLADAVFMEVLRQPSQANGSGDRRSGLRHAGSVGR
jgi:hypothetical protein